MGSQDLQTARYDQLIRRVGGLYGGGSKVVEALPELFPVLELENTTPELLALTGWRMAWQSTERPGVVGETSVSQLRNPVGSGMLVAVTQVLGAVNSNGNIQVEISTTNFGTPVSGLYRDARFGTPRSTAAQVASADDIAVGGGLRIFFSTGAARPLFDDNGICVLTPGSNLNIGTVNNNVVMTINYLWRERIALESELLFP